MRSGDVSAILVATAAGRACALGRSIAIARVRSAIGSHTAMRVCGVRWMKGFQRMSRGRYVSSFLKDDALQRGWRWGEPPPTPGLAVARAAAWEPRESCGLAVARAAATVTLDIDVAIGGAQSAENANSDGVWFADGARQGQRQKRRPEAAGTNLRIFAHLMNLCMRCAEIFTTFSLTRNLRIFPE